MGLMTVNLDIKKAHFNENPDTFDEKNMHYHLDLWSLCTIKRSPYIVFFFFIFAFSVESMGFRVRQT